ncbi:MAG: glutamine--fructose-6-phosphate transaminase (isomerizing) [Aestuariivita sp.]|nr:glutamine--fructose-6-phosphate transaminase (isomerizing) [Aestuariivita sp.]
MCGIVGVLSNHEVAPILVEALKRVEYRGYDSAGLATINAGHLDCRRSVGKLINLSDLLVHEPLQGKSGIGHTRWATHGEPTIKNAHPHRAGKVAVVHNGIIENYLDIREKLKRRGIECTTDTDTETIALLANHSISQGKTAVEAAFATLNELKGAFALAFLFDGEDDLIVAARKGSPLAIGYGDNEMYLGSDAIALAPLTDRLTYLEDNDKAVITRANVEIYDANGTLTNRPVKVISAGTGQPDKSGFKHYMEKEIAEQPSVVKGLLQQYLTTNGHFKDIPLDIGFREFDRLILVGCGTAFYACLVAKYWFERIARLPVEVDIASEFRYRVPPIGNKTLALFVSQSGETADTLEALRYCTGKAAQTLSIVNVTDSSIARESGLIFPIQAGLEIGVASTKAFTCQLTVLLILALKAAFDKEAINDAHLSDHIASLKDIPTLMRRALDHKDDVQAAALHISLARDVLFLGRGLMYPLAMEGALKLKEISYIHAEAYASGELKHGPIALIDNQIPIVMMAAPSDVFRKSLSNLQEVLARKGKVILVSDEEGIQAAGHEITMSVKMPKVSPLVAPILYALPAQLLAYYTAVAKGTDIDQPRNLAKSVTVE